MLSPDLLAAEQRIAQLCRRELAALNLMEANDDLDQARRTERARELASRFMGEDDDAMFLTSTDSAQMIDAVIADLFYLGPIEGLLADETVTEIMVNAPDEVWVERGGLNELTEVRFADDDHVKFVIDRIAAATGRRCDEASPLCDCVLRRPGATFDGSRVNAVCKGISVNHHLLDVRKFKKALSAERLLDLGAYSPEIMELLRGLVRGRVNIIVAGGTGSGKTTMLNALSSFIPDADRIITIEDTPELKLQKTHVISEQARPKNIEGEGEITIQQLVANALRQKPDRIVVGECRRGEAFDMIQAMSTGHDGSLTTLHAESAKGTLTRLRSMIQLAGTHMQPEAIMELICRSVDFIVYVRRYPDGSKRVQEVLEVCGMEGDVPTTATIMRFAQDPYTPGGRVTGRFESTGTRPTREHIEKLAGNGVVLPDSLFQMTGGGYGF